MTACSLGRGNSISQAKRLGRLLGIFRGYLQHSINYGACSQNPSQNSSDVCFAAMPVKRHGEPVPAQKIARVIFETVFEKASQIHGTLSIDQLLERYSIQEADQEIIQDILQARRIGQKRQRAQQIGQRARQSCQRDISLYGADSLMEFEQIAFV